MALEIQTPGALTTVQDAGRCGFAAQGFPQSGAADGYAYRLANLLAGNAESDAVLEMTLSGITARFTEDTLFALTGADLAATLDGVPLPPCTPAFAKAGSVLKTGLAQTGLRGYLAVHGGFDLPPVMGSRSTNLKCGMGGFCGRALQKGDLLPARQTPTALGLHRLARFDACKSRFLAHDGYLCRASRPWRFVGGSRFPLFRAVPGPQEERFAPAGLQAFTHGLFTVTPDSNRMACKLSGPALALTEGADILSDGIVSGSVQVSANGQPIVMLADHQTTGGYAKIATVIGADLPALAQVRPGEKIAFCFVTPGEAVAAARRQAQKLSYIKECLA